MAQNQLFSEEEIKNILDKDLLELMGAKNMPDEEKAALYEKMAQTVQDRVLLRVDDLLDEEGQKEFVSIIDTGDQEKTNQFLLGKNINVPQLIIQEAMLYKMEMMSILKLGKNRQGE